MMRWSPLVTCLALGCASAPQARFATGGELLTRLDSQSSCSRAVSGEAKVAFRGDARRLNASVLFLAAAPNRLRFDVQHSVAGNLATLTTDGSRFALASLEERRFYVGPSSACNVAKFTRVPAPPSVFVELLRNRAPRLAAAGEWKLEESRPLFGGFHYDLRARGAEGEATLRVTVHPDDYSVSVEKQRLRLETYSLSREGKLVFDAELSGHAAGRMATSVASPEDLALGIEPLPLSGPECSAELPTEARFYVEETGFELSLGSMKLEHNPALPEGVFSQEVRPGLTWTDSSCSDGAVIFEDGTSVTP